MPMPKIKIGILIWLNNQTYPYNMGFTEIEKLFKNRYDLNCPEASSRLCAFCDV